MRRIVKYMVPIVGTTRLPLSDPKFLAVGWQGQGLVVWVDVAWPTAQMAFEYDLAAVMTGQSPPEDGTYVGTATLSDPLAALAIGAPSPFVVHVYWRQA